MVTKAVRAFYTEVRTRDSVSEYNTKLFQKLAFHENQAKNDKQ